MPRVKQASKQKRTTKAATAKLLGAAGLSFSLVGSASASTMPTAGIPQSDNTSPNQRFVLDEEEMADVSLATFYVFDRENVGSRVQLVRGCGGGGGCGHGGGGCGGCGRGGGGAAGAAMLAAGVSASVVAVVADLLAAEVAVASVVAVVAVAAAAGLASGSMTTSGPVAMVAAAHPGERAACAKSHDLTASLTKDSAKLRSASRWLRV